jgi:hypothetical protein
MRATAAADISRVNDPVALMLVSMCSSLTGFAPGWPLALVTTGLAVTDMIFFLVVIN